MKRIVDSFIKRHHMIKFNKVLSNVIDTPPIYSINTADVLLVSQVHHAAVKMSLIAIKSFVQKFGQCKIELIDDGSLTKDDVCLLREHIKNVSVIDINEIDTFGCPRGGTWERLCYLLTRTEHYYVIQLDSDTVTIGALPEIREIVNNNHGFTIGGPMFPDPVPIDYMAQLARNWNNNHVQAKAEMNLTELKVMKASHYLRGCSAFTGFPKGANLLTLLPEVSEIMEEKLGKETWSEWGTEQFSSNVMQSLCGNSQVLKWPKYHNHGFPDYETKQSGLAGYLGKVSLIHFIGPTRFSCSLYTETVKHTIQNLR
ncbi:hypothetical protein ACP3VU_18430 [Vibrio sp. PNB23_22_6]|uniref:hypothetical protein n=1 Tax=Vibrio TaxID=662 RepID=UPI004068437B